MAWSAREIDNFYRSGYIDMIRLQAMQLDSNLSDTVDHEEFRGALTMIDRYGAPTLVDGSTRSRHADVATTSEMPRSRRSVAPAYWEYPEYFDPRDDVNLDRITSPDGQFFRAVKGALYAKKDSIIVTCLDGNALEEDGSTTIAFAADGGTTIDHNFAGGASAGTGLTVDKVVKANATLRANNVTTMVPWYLACHPNQVQQIFGDTVNSNSDSRLTSGDFNAMKPLQSGEPTYYCGFNWRQTTQIATEGTDAFASGVTGKYAFAYAQDAACLVMSKDIEVRASVIEHKGGSLLIYHSMIINATRVDGAKVVRIECAE